MEEEKEKIGRPLKFKSLEELKKKIDEYFKETDIQKYTITGLALALNTCRQTLLNYEEKDEFLDTIKRAKLIVENAYELSLRENGKAGDIFGLKNFGWKDKTEVDQTISGNLGVIQLPERNKEENKEEKK